LVSDRNRLVGRTGEPDVGSACLERRARADARTGLRARGVAGPDGRWSDIGNVRLIGAAPICEADRRGCALRVGGTPLALVAAGVANRRGRSARSGLHGSALNAGIRSAADRSGALARRGLIGRALHADVGGYVADGGRGALVVRDAPLLPVDCSGRKLAVVENMVVAAERVGTATPQGEQRGGQECMDVRQVRHGSSCSEARGPTDDAAVG